MNKERAEELYNAVLGIDPSKTDSFEKAIGAGWECAEYSDSPEKKDVASENFLLGDKPPYLAALLWQQVLNWVGQGNEKSLCKLRDIILQDLNRVIKHLGNQDFTQKQWQANLLGIMEMTGVALQHNSIPSIAGQVYGEGKKLHRQILRILFGEEHCSATAEKIREKLGEECVQYLFRRALQELVATQLVRRDKQPGKKAYYQPLWAYPLKNLID